MSQSLFHVLVHIPLAQIPGLGPDDAVPGLADPPLLEHWFLESPATPIAGLALAGAVAFLVLNRMGRARRGLLVAGILLACAAGVAVLAGAVTTTRERLIRQSGELVNAVATGDGATVRGFLADDVSLTVLQTPSGRTRDGIVADVNRVMPRGSKYAVKQHSIIAASAEVEGPTVGVTQLRIRVVPEMVEYPLGSWWRLKWRRDADGVWRVVHIEAMQIDGAGRGPLRVEW